MNNIFDNFKKWAEKALDDIVVHGSEIRINSVFTEDSKHHLWCSPSGGKTKRKNGVFHCFKTDKKGSLVKLIQIVDKCSYEDAYLTLNGRTSIRELEDKLYDFFDSLDEQEAEPTVVEKKTITLPEGSSLISSLPKNNFWRNLATEYLEKRKIPADGLYICRTAPYKARIVIPYYDKDGDLFYFNARHVGKSSLRYLGPDKSIGIGKGDVLFMAGGAWPEKDSFVYVCEGEFDALSIHHSGLNSIACGGKNLSEKQMSLIKDYKIVICLDNDKAGLQGSTSMSMMASQNMQTNGSDQRLMFVSPYKSYKDWNEMYIKEGPKILKNYILASRKNLDFQAPIGTGGDYFKIKGI
jgi:DNA primase